MKRTLISLIALWMIFSEKASANEYSVKVLTEIENFDPLSGMKSTHIAVVDFDKKTVISSYTTGTTDLYFGIDLNSVRDNFKVENISFRNDKVSFSMVGATASGVHFMPDIDYRFEVKFDVHGNLISLDGCHDGYPSYKTSLDAVTWYSYKHKPLRLPYLLGSCDIIVE